MSVHVAAVVLVLVLVLTVMFIPQQEAADGRTRQGDAGTRLAVRWRWGGVVSGAIAALLVAVSMGLGRGLLLAAPVFSLGVVLGVVVGELRVPRPAGPVRRAAVETRSVRDYLPRRLAAFVVAAGLTELLLLVWTTAMGSADDLGRAGRALTRVCGDMTTTKGPWPGSFYSVPLGAAVVAGLLLAGVGLWRVVGRPRPVDQSGELVHDDHARRLSAAAITGACGVLVAVPLLGASLVASAALIPMPCAPASWKLAGWALVLLAGGWFVLLVWSTKAILLPNAQRNRVSA